MKQQRWTAQGAPPGLHYFDNVITTAEQGACLEQFQSLVLKPVVVLNLVQPGGKKNPFCVRPYWYIRVLYAQTTLREE